jgi:hypothetical protein
MTLRKVGPGNVIAEQPSLQVSKDFGSLSFAAISFSINSSMHRSAPHSTWEALSMKVKENAAQEDERHS